MPSLSVPILSRAARAALLERALERAPHDVATVDTWFFAHAAMLEDPPFTPVDEEVVVCEGWRRDFCLTDPLARGRPDAPGVLLGLLAGGRCTGVAWRVTAQRVREDLLKVFDEELRLPFHKPTWTQVRPPRGGTFALALVADEESPLFEPTLSRDEVLARLRGCRGVDGRNDEYLETVAAGLTRRRVPDLELSRLLRDLRRPGAKAS